MVNSCEYGNELFYYIKGRTFNCQLVTIIFPLTLYCRVKVITITNMDFDSQVVVKFNFDA
jgi:hypothetical protein